MLIGAVARDEEVIIPTAEMVIEPGDRVIALITYRDLRKGEAILAGTGRDRP